jgi:hypothetical protein
MGWPKSQAEVEATGEMLIVAIGFGVFIPWFARKNPANLT